jgi:hypothetical protein
MVAIADRDQQVVRLWHRVQNPPARCATGIAVRQGDHTRVLTIARAIGHPALTGGLALAQNRPARTQVAISTLTSRAESVSGMPGRAAAAVH